MLEPGTSFVPGIHVDAICAHLQAVIDGKIRDLIINVPPGHAKSLLTCVFWPAWAYLPPAVTIPLINRRITETTLLQSLDLLFGTKSIVSEGLRRTSATGNDEGGRPEHFRYNPLN